MLTLQLQLVEQLAAALRGLAVLLAPQLGDQQLVMAIIPYLLSGFSGQSPSQ
jgi:hypothetical protein